MNKLKEFFQKKGVMIAEAVLLGAAAIGLTLGGLTAEGITAIATMSVAVLSAIDAVATFIASLIGKKKETKEE